MQDVGASPGEKKRQLERSKQQAAVVEPVSARDPKPAPGSPSNAKAKHSNVRSRYKDARKEYKAQKQEKAAQRLKRNGSYMEKPDKLDKTIAMRKRPGTQLGTEPDRVERRGRRPLTRSFVEKHGYNTEPEQETS